MSKKFVIRRDSIHEYFCDAKGGLSSWSGDINDAKLFDNESHAARIVYGLINDYSGVTNYMIELKEDVVDSIGENRFGVCPNCKSALTFFVTSKGKYYFECGDSTYCGFGGIIREYLPQHILKPIQDISKCFVEKSVNIKNIISKLNKKDRGELGLCEDPVYSK